MAPELPPAAPTWDDVLAQCEASAAEAEALLQTRGTFDPEQFAARRELDLWQLSLPPLPADLVDRARAVHQRQLQLQAALVLSMNDISHELQLTRDGRPAGSTAAIYLDRSA